MQIVIDIPEGLYRDIKEFGIPCHKEERNELSAILDQGIALPEHGRLIDADKFKEEYPLGNLLFNNMIRKAIDQAPTILKGVKDADRD